RSHDSLVCSATRRRASSPASIGDLPLRISSTAAKLVRFLSVASPRPVAPQDPIALSTYNPAPRMHESPARPGILNASPLVDVTHEMSCRPSIAAKWTVPVGRGSGRFSAWRGGGGANELAATFDGRTARLKNSAT